jgi:hypothetical protein
MPLKPSKIKETTMSKPVTNAQLITILNKHPLKLRAIISGCETWVCIEKQDFKFSIEDRPNATEWEVDVDSAIYISRIPY